ncbi:Peroxisome biogenesis protein 16 [Platanthera zijinensis]|uniref:Peroxisomal membrane protein PEX16 n=1 Tax=Platanthera zijinensis TaxID=2320716 RepID=A0AAP0BJS6_9ASPA
MVSLCISMLKDLETVVEVAAEHFYGKEVKWNFLIIMEFLKFINLKKFTEVPEAQIGGLRNTRMSVGQLHYLNAENHAPSSPSEDPLWEALEKSRRETAQRFQAINRTLAAITQRLEMQFTAAPVPPVNPTPASETPQVYPPAYSQVYPPVYQSTFPQGPASPFRSQNDEFIAHQNLFWEAARGSPARFLNFQGSHPYSSAPTFAPPLATFPFYPTGPFGTTTHTPFFPYAGNMRDPLLKNDHSDPSTSKDKEVADVPFCSKGVNQINNCPHIIVDNTIDADYEGSLGRQF